MPLEKKAALQIKNIIFMNFFSQVTISQKTTSQMYNFPNGNFPKVRLGPLRCLRLQLRPSAAARTEQALG